MVYGRTHTELLQLNEDSVYYGGKQDRVPYGAHNHLPRLRQLIRNGEHAKAEELVNLAFIPNPSAQRHYEPLATVKVEFDHDESAVTEYRRSLDLVRGVAVTSFQCDGVEWKRETLASYPDDVVVVSVTTSVRSRYVVRVSRFGEVEYDTNEFFDRMEQAGDGVLVMEFATGGIQGIHASCAVAAFCDDDGSVEVVGNNIVVESASSYLIITGQTSFRRIDPTAAVLDDIARARKGAKKLLGEHLVDRNGVLEDSAQLVLSDDSGPGDLPTDFRLQAGSAPELVQLYHDFGKHLIISSSRNVGVQPDLSLPSNLQGLWNPSFSPPWGCRYTININTQMNYWPCHIWGLTSHSDPLFFLLERMAERGQVTAKQMYGSQRKGAWCAHHNTDPWADTNPVDRWMPSTLWPLGGAWLCLHIWERYLFEGAEDQLCGKPFLQRMLPVLEGAVKFLLDFLVEDEEGRHLVTSPSLSPENSYWQLGSAGVMVKGTFCEGSTMDIQIISALFLAYLDIASIAAIYHDPEVRMGAFKNGGTLTKKSSQVIAISLTCLACTPAQASLQLLRPSSLKLAEKPLPIALLTAVRTQDGQERGSSVYTLVYTRVKSA
ncbi:hypothetical protein MBLNU230_g0673t1 [Neophaeotheca triangularis]